MILFCSGVENNVPKFLTLFAEKRWPMQFGRFARRRRRASSSPTTSRKRCWSRAFTLKSPDSDWNRICSSGPPAKTGCQISSFGRRATASPTSRRSCGQSSRSGTSCTPSSTTSVTHSTDKTFFPILFRRRRRRRRAADLRRRRRRRHRRHRRHRCCCARNYFFLCSRRDYITLGSWLNK